MTLVFKKIINNVSVLKLVFKKNKIIKHVSVFYVVFNLELFNLFAN